MSVHLHSLRRASYAVPAFGVTDRTPVQGPVGRPLSRPSRCTDDLCRRTLRSLARAPVRGSRTQ